MNKPLCIFGEVLFDIFPDGRHVLGGAPFNVSWHLQAFYQSPFFISSVGSDKEGNQIRQAMVNWGMDTKGLQTSSNLPTGQVVIELNDGEPHYDIVEPVSYDAIEAYTTEKMSCDFLYHGSLAVRNEVSLQALESLKQGKTETVFLDVNLRDPWWDKSSVTRLIHDADWVKLNGEEFALLYNADSGDGDELSSFIRDFNLQGVLLTHGKAGAEVMTVDHQHHKIKPAHEKSVVDTVGAGDAFSAVFILGLMNKWSLSLTLQRAQQFASEIVGQRGATVSEPQFYQQFIKSWNINAG